MCPYKPQLKKLDYYESAGIISKTYAELTTMVAGSSLVPGQQYLLSNFRTYYLIPNTGDYFTGTTEALVLKAISNNKFDIQAYSSAYPNDIIHYEFVDSSGYEGDRGRITYREDTVNNVVAFEDWRQTTYRRWISVLPVTGDITYSGAGDNDLTLTGSYNGKFDGFITITILGDGTTWGYNYSSAKGDVGEADLPVTDVPYATLFGMSVSFVGTTHTGGDNWTFPISKPIFCDISDNGLGYGYFDLKILDPFFEHVGFRLENVGYSNNVFMENTNKCLMGSDSYGNTLQGSFSGTKTGASFQENKCKGAFEHNTIESNFSGNNVLGEFKYNIIKKRCGWSGGNTFGAGFNYNSLGANFNSNNFGSDCIYNVIGDVFGNDGANTVGNGFRYNHVGTGCYGNTWGSGCEYNTVAENTVSRTYEDGTINGIAIGIGASTVKQSIAMGYGTRNTKSGSVTIGDGSDTNGFNSVNINRGVTFNDHTKIALGKTIIGTREDNYTYGVDIDGNYNDYKMTDTELSAFIGMSTLDLSLPTSYGWYFVKESMRPGDTVFFYDETNGIDLGLGTFRVTAVTSTTITFHKPIPIFTATGIDVVFKINQSPLSIFATNDDISDTTIAPIAFFEGDGTLVFDSTATVYDDLLPSSVTVATGANVPSFTAYNGNLRAYEFVGAALQKDIHLGFQIPHSYKVGSDIEPHLHLYIPDDVTGGDIRFYLEYTWTNKDDTGAIATNTIPGTITRTANQGINNNAILSFGAITGAGKEISSILMCRLYRNSTDGADTFGSSVWLKSADVHVEKSTLGSHTQYEK